METEDLDESSSWISTIALRNAADIKKIIKSNLHRKSASALPSEISIPLHIFPEITKGVELLLKPSHQRYNTTSLEKINSSITVESDNTGLEKKYLSKVTRLNEEIAILSEQLRQAYKIISRLSHNLNQINNKHALHLQAIQERHEQKMKKNQQEIEFLLASSKKNQKIEIEKLKVKSNEELEGLKMSFSNKFKAQEKDFFEEIEKKDQNYSKQITQQKYHFVEMIMDLRNKFIEELEYVQLKYKKKLHRFKEEVSKRSENYDKEFDEDGSTVLEVDFDRGRNRQITDQTLEEDVLGCFNERKYVLKLKNYRDIDDSIRNLLKQLK